MGTDAKTRKLIVWEPDGHGHRCMYVRFIAQFAKVNDIPFEIQTTHIAKARPEWQVNGLDAYPYRISESLRELVHAISSDTQHETQIIVPDADRWLLKLLCQWKSLRSIPMSLLIMRPMAGTSFSSKVNYLAKLTLISVVLSTFRRVTIFALTNPGMRLTSPYMALGIQSLFDPVEWNPRMDRSELGLESDQLGKTIFLVAGELSERKYISEIIQAWDTVQPENSLLVLVGSVAPKLVLELNTVILDSNSILCVDDYVSNDVFDSWISVADFIFILHRNSGSSGVALKAALSQSVVICGGNKSHIRSVQSTSPRCITLKHVSKESICNLLNTNTPVIQFRDANSGAIDAQSWAKLICRMR